MPRGVYDRSKTKSSSDEKSSTPKSIKTAGRKIQSKQASASGSGISVEQQFQILGSHLAILTNSGHTSMGVNFSGEVKETLEMLKELRLQTFSHLVKLGSEKTTAQAENGNGISMPNVPVPPFAQPNQPKA